MARRAIVTTVLLGAVLVAGTACTPAQDPGASAGARTVFPDARVADTIGQLPQESLAPMPAARLAEGLIPPTNRWFSGLVFGEAPEPVFPLPLAFSVTGSGFEFGVPTVQTGADTISAGPSADVAAAFPAAVTSTVTSTVVAYDDASVTIEFADADGTALGTVTVAEGSPLVSFTAETSTTLRLATPPVSSETGDHLLTTVAGREYGMVTDGAVDGADLTVKTGDTVTWFAVPDGGDADELAASADAVTGVELDYSVTDGAAATNLVYGTASSKDPLIAVLPHQYASLTAPAADRCALGTYDTVYGTMHLCSGRELSWSAPVMEPSASLALDGVDETTRTEIRAQLAEDVELPAEIPADTYFGGKALYRLANLLQLAVELDDAESADIARTRLVEQLTDWTDPGRCDTESTRCFVYDPVAKGLVGKVSAFGSDEFNDHHFHYGYLLFAASVAVADDPALMDRFRPVMDLVAADLATDGDGSFFPSQRVFDAYAGHSWASGYVPFRDGNNQESSSEAVAAWNGLALWADVTDNAPLADEARWMLANEAATAQVYWVGFDASQAVYQGYVPFRDGNNQESSSEAVAAWNGLALWADVTDNAPLADEARWMLANEAATAQVYWVGFDASQAVYQGYEHSVIALNWGAKRDYSTWFSAEPNAKLGIQLIPMSPASDYLAGDPERITANLAEATAGGYDVQFGDYMLMYAALRGPDAAAEAYARAAANPSLAVDDANSKAYLLAFAASRATP